MVLIVMGVSGCGKTTIGKMLGEKLGWKYYEGDEYHPKENVEKMRSGIPLNDDDRKPWLLALRSIIENHLNEGTGAVVSCSALKQKYRDLLKVNDEVKFIFLKGDFDTILRRMQARKNHYFKPEMLKSQFDALEEPVNVITEDIDIEPELIVNEVIEKIK